MAHPEVVKLRVSLAKIAQELGIAECIPGYTRHLTHASEKNQLPIACLIDCAKMNDKGWHDLAKSINSAIYELKKSIV